MTQTAPITKPDPDGCGLSGSVWVVTPTANFTFLSHFQLRLLDSNPPFHQAQANLKVLPPRAQYNLTFAVGASFSKELKSAATKGRYLMRAYRVADPHKRANTLY
jgi:hypothetical protein